MNKIFELSTSTKEAQIKGARHMEEVNKSIKFINNRPERPEKMEEDRKKRERQVSKLKNFK